MMRVLAAGLLGAIIGGGYVYRVQKRRYHELIKKWAGQRVLDQITNDPEGIDETSVN